jgi:hypothetical protein
MAGDGSALTLGYTYNQDHQRSGVSASDASFLVSGLTAASHAYAPTCRTPSINTARST